MKLALLIVCSLVLASCGNDGPRLPPLASDAVVLAFGDSLTAGKGVSRDQAFPAVLEELINRRVVNAGVSGETSGEGLKRLASALAQSQADLVILTHGGNDLLRKFPARRTTENLRKMVRLAQQQGAEVMLVAIPRPGIFLKAAPLYADLAAEMDLVIETDSITQVEKRPELKSDAVHPNAEGYAQIAEAVADTLRDAGALD